MANIKATIFYERRFWVGTFEPADAEVYEFILNCYNQIRSKDCYMPTILTIGSYRFYFYSHEPNEPAHIHVDKDSSSAKFWLEKVALADNIRFSKKELNEIHKLITEHQKLFLDRWHEYFGHKK